MFNRTKNIVNYTAYDYQTYDECKDQRALQYLDKNLIILEKEFGFPNSFLFSEKRILIVDIQSFKLIFARNSL